MSQPNIAKCLAENIELHSIAIAEISGLKMVRPVR
jgi:hypothetical protein